MDLETALSDPGLDLSMPPDALSRVHRQATRMRRRRQLALSLPVVGALAVLIPLTAAGSDRPEGYARLSPSTSPSAPGGIGRTPLDQTTQTTCVVSNDGRVRVDVQGPTGDPLDNCSRYWRSALDTPAPPLIAYQDEQGQVIVQPKDLPLPAGALVVPPGAQQGTDAIELTEALGDVVGARLERCRTQQQATDDVAHAVASMGISGWPLALEDRRVDRTRTGCWMPMVSTDDHKIRLIEVDNNIDFTPILEPIATPLRASLTQCWSMAKAEDEVRKALALPARGRVPDRPEFQHLDNIREVNTPGRRCTVIHLAGPDWQFTLRGAA